MSPNRCILTVHAHPDDESSKGAGTIARYHAEGVRTVLVTCTGGEEGDILNPAVDTAEVRANLASVRRRELEEAAAVIGYDVVELLGYRDSGMAGTPANDDPRSFAQAPLDEAVAKLVAIVRRERPQVMVAYGDDQKGYPHPDHLRAHEIAVAAFSAAGDASRYPEVGEAFQPLKLYYVGWSRDQAIARHEKFVELGIPSPYAERIEQGWLDEVPAVEPTTSISLAGFEHVRQAALRAHATQVDPTSPFWFGLPDDVERAITTSEQYVLAKSLVETSVPETDVFSGIEGDQVTGTK